MRDASVANIYEKIKDQEYPIGPGVNNGYSTPTPKNANANGNSVEKGIETNGFAVNLEKPYYLFCEDNVKRDEMIKPLIDYAMTNLYEPLNYVKKQNIQQYNTLEPYTLNHNNFLYHQVTNGYTHKTNGTQPTLNGYGDKPTTHTYNNVLPYNTHYQQQYNVYDYVNHSPNVNYNSDKNYTFISGDKCSTESSDPGEANKTCKEVSSIGDHSTEARSTIDNNSDNAVSNVVPEITNEELPFGKILSRYNEGQGLDLSNEASIQSNETVQSNTQNNSPSTNQIGPTNNNTSGLKYPEYNNYYYNDQLKQPIQNGHLMEFKPLYPQQLYNNKELPIDARVYNWQWPMYKIPHGMFQQHTYPNLNYQNIYAQRFLYNKTIGDKWKMDDSIENSSRVSIKRGKNSSAGRPRLNRTDYACSKCRARTTPQWRYLHGVAVCNACYMRARKEKMKMKRS